jgi:hypothetical protein
LSGRGRTFIKPKNIDYNQCLDELADVDWGKAPIHSTGLMQKIHELRKMPLAHWTNEDLRLMILQQISLELLLPVALYRLAKNPAASGETYTYDLDTIIDSAKIDVETFNEIVSNYRYSYQGESDGSAN